METLVFDAAAVVVALVFADCGLVVVDCCPDFVLLSFSSIA